MGPRNDERASPRGQVHGVEFDRSHRQRGDDKEDDHDNQRGLDERCEPYDRTPNSDALLFALAPAGKASSRLLEKPFDPRSTLGRDGTRPGVPFCLAFPESIHITPKQYTSSIRLDYLPQMPSPSPVFIDDLPSVAISRLVADRKITRDATRARIILEVSGRSSAFRVSIFPTGAGGCLSIVIAASRRSSLGSQRPFVLPALSQASWAWLRCRPGDPGPRIARLRASRIFLAGPSRLHPRPGRVLDRRLRLEASLAAGGVC